MSRRIYWNVDPQSPDGASVLRLLRSHNLKAIIVNYGANDDQIEVIVPEPLVADILTAAIISGHVPTNIVHLPEP